MFTRAQGGLIAILVFGLVGLAPPGTAYDPTSSEATFTVTTASCGFDPGRGEITASGTLKSVVHEVPSPGGYYYLQITLRIDHARPGGRWQRLAVKRSGSVGFGADRVPFAWRSPLRAKVVKRIAEHHHLSLKYRVVLKNERHGPDRVIWRHRDRSDTFGCRDGRPTV